MAGNATTSGTPNSRVTVSAMVEAHLICLGGVNAIEPIWDSI